MMIKMIVAKIELATAVLSHHQFIFDHKSKIAHVSIHFGLRKGPQLREKISNYNQ